MAEAALFFFALNTDELELDEHEDDDEDKPELSLFDNEVSDAEAAELAAIACIVACVLGEQV